MNVNILSFRNAQTPGLPGFQEYMTEVSSHFCPYVDASKAKDETAWTVLSSDTQDKEVAEKIVFASGWVLSELLRAKRSTAGSEPRSPLLCENVLFLFPVLDDSFGKELLGWPHWVLKCRYTQLGILFGKFWKNARETSKDGRELPVPPYNFLSVRESVRTKDPRFFEHAEWLLPALEASNDVGQNVFDDLSGYREVADAINLFCDTSTQLNFGLAIDILLGSTFYERAKEIASAELKAQKLRVAN